MTVLYLKRTFGNFRQELLTTGIFLITKGRLYELINKVVIIEEENMECLLNYPICFYNICTEALNQYAPRKKKYIRRNNKPFMNKTLSKAITLRAKLKNNLLKNPIKANSFLARRKEI